MCIYYGNYRLPLLIKRDLRSGRKRQIRATGIIGHELNKQNAFMLMTRPDPIYIITAYLSQWRAPVDTDLTIIIIHVMGPNISLSHAIPSWWDIHGAIVLWEN